MGVMRDEIDREHLRQTLETRGWQIIEQSIREIAGRKLQSLRQDLDPVQTAKVRGFLDALDHVLALPKTLLKEGPGTEYAQRQ